MIKSLAIYLPQYHPIPENDKVWGEGFTEWTNVRKAKPLFEGHYQPHVPSEDVGYYDLRDPEVMVKQAAMAKEYGIYGFAFYHYWFNGKRLLETPLDNMLKTGKPDFPFCYIWANENWTKRWDGLDQEIIIKQNYSFEDDLKHIQFLCENVFNDKRYITVNGKPLFIFYKPELFPDIKRTVEIFRTEAQKKNFDLYLCYFENGIDNQDPKTLGFEASVEFQPKWSRLPSRKYGSFVQRLLHKFKIKDNVFLKNNVFDYSAFSKSMQTDSTVFDYRRIPCVCPMWDNSSRRKNFATIFLNSTPKTYGKWLASAIKRNFTTPDAENFLILNAWNEWAEGNHLEPCKKWGVRYLEVTKKTLKNANSFDYRS